MTTPTSSTTDTGQFMRSPSIEAFEYVASRVEGATGAVGGQSDILAFRYHLDEYVK